MSTSILHKKRQVSFKNMKLALRLKRKKESMHFLLIFSIGWWQQVHSYLCLWHQYK